MSGKGDIDTESDNFLHLQDLGLIRMNNARLELANPIYTKE